MKTQELICENNSKYLVFTLSFYCHNDGCVGNPSDESSLEEPSVQEQSIDFAQTYEIVKHSTKRGKQKLIDNTGYTYNIQRRWGETTDWQCTVHGKANPCKARIIQRDVGNFEPGPHSHNHLAEVTAAMVAKVTARVKDKAAEDLCKPGSAIVDEVWINKSRKVFTCLLVDLMSQLRWASISKIVSQMLSRMPDG